MTPTVRLSPSGIHLYIPSLKQQQLIRHAFFLDTKEAESHLGPYLFFLVVITIFRYIVRRYPSFAYEWVLRIKILWHDFSHLISDDHIAQCYFELGLVCKRRGKFTEAIQYCEDSLDLQESLHGLSSPSTAKCHILLASIVGEIESYGVVIKCFNRALSVIGADRIGEDSASEDEDVTNYDTIAALAWNNMALLEKNHGMYGQALYYYKKSIEVYEREDCVAEAAIVYSNASLLFLKTGNHEKALQFIQRSIQLKVESQEVGPFHLSTATSHNNHGLILYEMERHEEALSCHGSAIEIREKILGKSDKSTKQSYYDSARAFKQMGNVKESNIYFRKAMKIPLRSKLQNYISKRKKEL